MASFRGLSLAFANADRRFYAAQALFHLDGKGLAIVIDLADKLDNAKE